MSHTLLTSIQWRALEWVLAFGPLNRENVMAYFSMSPFFDKTSNNAVLTMQNSFRGQVMSHSQTEQELTKLVGIEYVISQDSAPHLFVITKQYRTDELTADPIAVYFVTNATIYESPSLYATMGERLATADFFVAKALKALETGAWSWSPDTKYVWTRHENEQTSHDPAILRALTKVQQSR